MKEEIQKAPSEDHPCRLTRTSVKISFPQMKSEVFVNFLGYKEPNLMHLQRCKGHCGGMGSQIACIATKVRQKKVKMTVKTQLIGRDPRQKYKEMVLEEHTECGCQCLHISELSCLQPGRFNNRTCECECDEAEYGRAKMLCDRRKNAYWDSTSCSCKSKSVAPRGVELPSECAGLGPPLPEYQQPGGGGYLPAGDGGADGSGDGFVTWAVMACFVVAAVVLSTSTFYYRRKFRRLLGKGRSGGGGSSRSSSSRKSDSNNGRAGGQGGGGGAAASSSSASSGSTSKKAKKSKKSSSKEEEGGRHRVEIVDEDDLHKMAAMAVDFPRSPAELQLVLAAAGVGGTSELYHEQYNEHGVKIEPELTDHELIQQYLGQQYDMAAPPAGGHRYGGGGGRGHH